MENRLYLDLITIQITLAAFTIRGPRLLSSGASLGLTQLFINEVVLWHPGGGGAPYVSSTQVVDYAIYFALLIKSFAK